MNKKPCARVLASMKNQHWAIRPEALETLFSIAQRQYSNPAQALELSEEYKSSGLSPEETPGVAIIDVTGPIFARADIFTEISGATSCETLTLALDEALEDPAIQGIVFRFDSPGGQVTGTHELAHHIYKSRDIKPIVSYVSGSAASAAYWLASATSYIFTDRVSSLGCLGIVAAWTDDTAAKEKAGLVEYEVVSSQTPNKRQSLNSDEGRATLQKELDGLADIFISDIALFRGVSTEKVLSDFGQGGTLLADSAIDVGLADELNNLRDVVALLSESENNVAINKTGDPTMAGFKRFGSKKNNLRRNASKSAQELDPTEELTPEELEEERLRQEEEEERRQEEENNNEALDEEEDFEPIEDEEEEEDAEEDEDRETTAIHRRVNQLAKSQPNLYKAILRRGARRERRRIESIEGLEAAGRESIIQAAKYSSPKTIGATSRSILRAEKKRNEQRLNDYRHDAQFNSPPLSGGAGGSASNQALAEKALLEHVKFGASNKTGVKKV
ncbi:S49 family peptidase [Serratia sp. MF2]|uniref:S49 family peptidase n=1 Tax=Serratia sp. MF1(2023) TaxID=3059171 RepID=UPI0027E810A6|nr:S49 family peptidase [Serratia sp. MF1(2023)]MDQ7104200.1 S49 family peptidase [Serratia sp. MF1(2023)]